MTKWRIEAVRNRRCTCIRLLDHIWSCHDLDLWPFDLKI